MLDSYLKHSRKVKNSYSEIVLALISDKLKPNYECQLQRAKSIDLLNRPENLQVKIKI